MSVTNPHEILGLEPGASPEQVERAYRFCLDLYADTALATYSLLDADEVIAARRRVQEAYEKLTQVEEPEPVRMPPAAAAVTAPRPEPVSDAPRILPSPVTGPALRRFREERGIALRDIANETKIGMRFLEYIEADRHQMLPAQVYLRGFLQQYARMVGLDPRATAEAYLARLPS
ncbi:MAG TPA: helix-turn-helix domain-containing protein [Vicinamibacteria bacterium]|jgi:flagellar biosynthesis protein FlhG